MKHALLAATALLGFSVPYAANAVVILTLGQSSSNQAITATANGAGTSTTITAADAPVSITQIDGGVPSAAFFDMSVTSTTAALSLGNGGFQHYAGSFSITSAAGGGGTNFLSGMFSDIVLGVGTGGGLSAGAPPDTINFTSSVIPALDLPRAIALAFANLSPAFNIDNATIGSFTSSVSGTFSASPAAVPEPASWALMGMGLLGLGVAVPRRRGGGRRATDVSSQLPA